MRVLEHKLAHARGTVRRAVSRLGLTDPNRLRPARLVLRIDDGDLEGSLGTGERTSSARLQRIVIEMVDWLGPVPMTLLATREGGSHLVETLVRFAHRLECPTQLVTAGKGIDQDRAEALVDCGLMGVRVLVGGVSDGVQRSVVGQPAIEATDAVMALLAARESRRAALDIEVGIPWKGRADEELRAVVGWARQVGVDGFRVIAPYKATDLPVHAELLDEIAGASDDFNRTDPATLSEIHAMVVNQDSQPGAPRTHGKLQRRRFSCPVGGQRLEFTTQGHISSCPFKTPIAEAEGSVEQIWAGAGAHLEAIKSCDRVCAHVELAPQRIWG
jgi:hypothetical protein